MHIYNEAYHDFHIIYFWICETKILFFYKWIRWEKKGNSKTMNNCDKMPMSDTIISRHIIIILINLHMNFNFYLVCYYSRESLSLLKVSYKSSIYLLSVYLAFHVFLKTSLGAEIWKN